MNGYPNGTCTSGVATGNKYSHMDGPSTCEDGLCKQKFVQTTYPASKLSGLKVEGYMIYGGKAGTAKSWCRQYWADSDISSSAVKDFMYYHYGGPDGKFIKSKCPKEYTQLVGGLQGNGDDGFYT